MAKKKKVERSCKVAKQPVFQNHHIIYANEERRVKEVTRRIRKGVHQAMSLLRRFTFLTDQEVDTIRLESELKRKYDEPTECALCRTKLKGE